MFLLFSSQKYSADFDDVVERRPAVIELVETERNFIKTLKTIQDPFFKTLTPYLSDDDQEFAVILEVGFLARRDIPRLYIGIWPRH